MQSFLTMNMNEREVCLMNDRPLFYFRKFKKTDTDAHRVLAQS